MITIRIFILIFFHRKERKGVKEAFKKIYKSSDVWLSYLNSLYKIKGHGDQELINILSKKFKENLVIKMKNLIC